MHSSRIRTARSLPYREVCVRGWGVSVQGGSLSKGVSVQERGLCQEDPVNRKTDRCKNIILPQTSFAGGKN